jgi:4-carboxymuconolactone decarboxylase
MATKSSSRRQAVSAATPLRKQRFHFRHNDDSPKENDMDKELMEAGLKVRREVLGDEYVDRSMKNADEFSKPFQEVVSEYCWGLAWTDETLSRRERSILNLGMIAALGKPHEFELHLRGAMRNGLTKEELRAVMIHIAVYCGIPVGVDCFRIAKQVFAADAKA